MRRGWRFNKRRKHSSNKYCKPDNQCHRKIPIPVRVWLILPFCSGRYCIPLSADRGHLESTGLDLARYRKTGRSTRTPAVKRTHDPGRTHFSVARTLQQRKVKAP
jgi:hypothetical protein